MSGSTTSPQGADVIDDTTYAFLSDVIGRKAALTVIDLLDDDSPVRYRSFFPVGEMLIGLRFHENDPSRLGMKTGHTLKIVEGRIAVEPRRDMMFTPPQVPHRSEHIYGFWHINDEQELAMNLKLGDQRRVTVLVEGFPKRGRRDRFAWFCTHCVNPLYMREVETGRVGLPGFYAVEEDAFKVFNEDLRLRTCQRCGTVHPVAYSIFAWNDTPEQKAARAAA
jgi:hypothetical protein